MLCFIQPLIRMCSIKVCCDYTFRWPRPLLPRLSTVTCINKFFNNGLLFKATNFGCVDSTWVFMGMIPLSLLYLIRPFHKVDCWHKSRTLACYVLQIMHCIIYGFSTSTSKLSLTTKKTLAYWSSTMWLPSYNLGSYSYKLYFNLNTIWRRNNKTNTNRSMHMHVLNIWCWWRSITTWNTNIAKKLDQMHIIFISHHLVP